jgi:sugar-phosphatase
MNTVILDMDGLLIDSEPLWQEAGSALLSEYGIQLSDEQYHSSTGLRTPEWVEHWFGVYGVDRVHAPSTITRIEQMALELIAQKGQPMPGVDSMMEVLRTLGCQIGLASSSPLRLIDTVIDKLHLRTKLAAIVSAEKLPFGKPHPEVFLHCAERLQVKPAQCLVLEDSFNGLIAAKAAKMKCVVVPAPAARHLTQWEIADCRLNSLEEFDQEVWKKVTGAKGV